MFLTNITYFEMIPSPLKEISGSMTVVINIILVSTNTVCMLSLICSIFHKSKSIGIFDFYIMLLSGIDILESLIPGIIWVIYEFSNPHSIESISCIIYRSTVNTFQILSLSIIFCVTFFCCLKKLNINNPIVFLRFFLLSLFATSFIALIFFILPLTTTTSFSTSSWICLQGILIHVNKSKITTIQLLLFLSISTILIIGIILSLTLILLIKPRPTNPGIYTVHQSRPVDYRHTKLDVQQHKIISLVVFFQILTWIPFLISLILLHCEFDLPVLAVHFLSLSTQLNGAFNPLIYAIFSKKYRVFYCRLIPQTFRKKANFYKLNKNLGKSYFHRPLFPTDFSLSTKTASNFPGALQSQTITENLVLYAKCHETDCDAVGKEMIMRRFLEDNPIFDTVE